jgi:cation:H+ antiporter
MATVAGFAMALSGGRLTTRHAVGLAERMGISPFVVGATILSVGTDLPEIANSIVACAAGHGDLNVGDSVGSVSAQITLVLGLFPLLGGPLLIDRRRTFLLGGQTAVALLFGLIIQHDGFIGRWEGAFLLGIWVLLSVLNYRLYGLAEQPARRSDNHKKGWEQLAGLAAGLLLITIGAMIAIEGIIILAEAMEIPSYYISFFGASIGTSMPELFLDIAALRSGRKDIAMGDVLGSCMVDATLSIGIGPLFSPGPISAGLAVRGTAVTAIAVLLATGLLAYRGRHDRRSAVLLLAVYGATYYLLVH